MNVPTKMWQDMGGVELFHRGGGDEFVGISEALDERLEFADDGGDLLVEFEFLLDLEPKKSGLWRLFQVHIRHHEVNIISFSWVEDGETGLASVWNEVVAVEVFDEAVEF